MSRAKKEEEENQAAAKIFLFFFSYILVVNVDVVVCGNSATLLRFNFSQFTVLLFEQRKGKKLA